MNRYLVGIMYHEPDAWSLWQQGAIEDYESSCGLFVEAACKEDALSWGATVGEALLRFVNDNPKLDWQELSYHCWIEEAPDRSDWSHCLTYFQTVTVGTMPDLTLMTSESYEEWCLNHTQQRDAANRADP